MIIIIHGDDIVSSRKILDEEKEKRAENETLVFDGNSLDLSTLLTADQSQSLFQNQKTIIIENLLSTSGSSQKEKLFSYLSSNQLVSDVIIWEKSEVNKNIIKKYFPSGRVIFCQPPLLLFRFLDTFFDRPSLSLSLFHSVIEQREAELVYSMLIRQFRNLIIARDLGVAGLSDMQRWQAEKFVKQSGHFEKEKLISMYRQLLSIDYIIKSGRTPFTMTELLDIYLLSL